MFAAASALHDLRAMSLHQILLRARLSSVLLLAALSVGHEHTPCILLCEVVKHLDRPACVLSRSAKFVYGEGAWCCVNTSRVFLARHERIP
jgi:hypothetical protein